MLAVYAVTKAALDAARSGQGPTFIEAYTYRMGAHTTSDDPTKYRVSAEVEVWKHRDPIERFKRWLDHRGRADADFFDAVEEEADELGASVRERLPGDARPRRHRRCSTTSTSSRTRSSSAERAEFAAYQASFEGAH